MELSERAVYPDSTIGQLAKAESSRQALAKWYLAASIAAVFVLLVWKFGYPFLIVCALAGTALALTAIVILTAADLFTKKSVVPAAQRQAKRH